MSREMKDSGVAWIGEIPKGWGVSNVGKFFHIILGKMLQPNRINENDTLEKYLCAANVGKNTLSLNEIKEMWFTEKEKEQYALQKGDLLVVEGGDVASSAIININVTNIYIQNALHRVRAKFNDDIRFLRYMLTASKAVGHIDLICNKATIAHFTKDKFSKLTYLIPPLSEQQSIANYLDEKCAEIDNLISLLEEMIGELKAYKQSVITETVCKGLNKNAPMKDSGIEWIGEIPKDWSICRLKNASWLKGRIGWQGLKSSEYQDEGAYLITGTDFKDGYINWESCVHISKERFEEDADIHIQEDDLLITKDGTIGKVAIAKNCPTDVSLNSGVMLIRNERAVKYIDKYLYYTLISDVFWTWFNSSLTGNSTILHLYQAQFYNFPFVCPPLSEQQTIANYLDEKCGNIEGLIGIKQAKIDELKEFKKSLIYEYVTGKKSVI